MRQFELTVEGGVIYRDAKMMRDKQTTLLTIEAVSSKISGHLKSGAVLNLGRQYVASSAENVDWVKIVFIVVNKD